MSTQGETVAYMRVQQGLAREWDVISHQHWGTIGCYYSRQTRLLTTQHADATAAAVRLLTVSIGKVVVQNGGAHVAGRAALAAASHVATALHCGQTCIQPAVCICTAAHLFLHQIWAAPSITVKASGPAAGSGQQTHTHAQSTVTWQADRNLSTEQQQQNSQNTVPGLLCVRLRAQGLQQHNRKHVSMRSAAAAAG